MIENFLLSRRWNFGIQYGVHHAAILVFLFIVGKWKLENVFHANEMLIVLAPLDW